ncbi:hypothetical protein DFAR_1030008 [Desulfarculales bacterium]
MYQRDSDREWFLAGSAARNFSGLALKELDCLELGRARDVLNFSDRWRDFFQALIYFCVQKPETYGDCTILAGAASGYASACLGREVLVRELACAAECWFEGQTVKEWGLAPEGLRQ